jgi:hypothetical protein
MQQLLEKHRELHFQKLKHIFYFSRLRNSAEKWHFQLAQWLVVTASFFKFSITSSTFYCIAKLPFQLSKCCFVNFFGGVAVMPHKYIFQSKGIGSSEYRTNIM